jgi:CubicO group peptidase (beta-lactamase class C family)
MGLHRSWLAALIAMAATAAAAQPLAPTPKPPAAAAAAPALAPAGPALNKADLEAWLDGLMPYALQRGDVAGAVVTVVKDGQPILEKGYGYADVAKKTPVTPDTMFRPGSVSKLFTWTSVMQLVGEGKIDLDKDVNAYLDFKIPARADGPVTMRRLMTHTAGFEETIQGLISGDPKRLDPLDASLKRWVPTRVYAVGTTPAYSNYGAALAGYIVQRVSGEPFEQYVERHIFMPLGMTHSTMRQPLPAQFQAFMAKGYKDASSPAVPYELISMSPAGALAASGSDMSKFMIAQLADEHGGNRLMPANIANEMHRTPGPGVGPLNRIDLGFYQSNMNGHAIVSHGGDTEVFHSDLNLFIDDGVGLYISMNSAGREGAAHQIRAALLREFANRYFPGPQWTGSVDAKTAKAHAAMMAGVYSNSRASFSNFASLVYLLDQTKVAALPDGKIVVSGINGLNGQPLKWHEISPFVWTDEAGDKRLAAEVRGGRVFQFSTDDFAAIFVFRPTPFGLSSAWLLPALIGGLGALALTALLWPVTAMVRRKYGARFALEGRDAASHRAARIGAAGAVLVVCAWLGLLLGGMANLDFFGPPATPWLALLGIVGPIVLLAALVAVVWDMLNVWRRRKGWGAWFARLWSVVLVLGVLVAIWVALSHHLYGLNTHY